MKLCSRKIASGSAKIVCESHNGPEGRRRCPSPRTGESSGISAICSGTICSANTATNRKLRPWKSIHAKRVRGERARCEIGMSTAGRVMTTELMK